MRKAVPLKDLDGIWHFEPDMWYRCLSCHQTLPASPRASTSCKCGNVEIDVGYGRLSIRDEEMVEAFVDDELSTT
jgi:hypothetical protein